jgi:hypothetical protein
MNVLKGILLSIAVLAVLTAIGFYSGFIGNFYDSTVGRQQMDVQRENFEHNKSYVHGKIDDIAKYKREYERAKTKDEKEQVRNIILDDFANFDPKLIDNADLYNFLKDMENGN